ncbi:class I SAM-dependent DNA methyltransferase [Thiomicrospira pelophila]|uniref:class I SAM-dependent DNA methyltransferase n=1 Tax=Thiomicrospira pelophila TaxID=934 RepID=UPI0004A76B46|nr:class I SAM-dependent methyltransferase [Thiomicrospira pelophila]
MSKEWDEYAEGWDSNSDVISYSAKAFDSLSKVVDIKGLRVLDFGCGTGLLTERISPLAKEIVALDTSNKMISILNQKKLVNVVALTDELTESLVNEGDLFSNKFDVVVASSVCAFLPCFEDTLSLIKSILKPNGTFVQWDWLAEIDDGDFGLSKDRVIEAYNSAGLKLHFMDEPFTMNDMKVLMAVGKNA